MRAFLNAVLTFIGAASLTDLEYDFASGELDDTASDSDNYAVLDSILEDRGSVSQSRDRLRYYYIAKGLELGEVDAAQSNILLGGSLE
jgi:hypothetical protein